jgi:hypothetical protein
MANNTKALLTMLMAQAAVMGSAPGGAIENIISIGRRSLARKRRAPRKRLQIATGPGSISAKAQIQQLCWAERFKEAGELARQHFEDCGEVVKVTIGRTECTVIDAATGELAPGLRAVGKQTMTLGAQ